MSGMTGSGLTEARFSSTNHNSFLRTVPNEIASFYILIIDYVKWLFFGAKAGLRVMLRYFEIKKGFLLLYKTNRFHAALRLFNNRLQKTSKCGKNISDTLGYASCATFFVRTSF